MITSRASSLHTLRRFRPWPRETLCNQERSFFGLTEVLGVITNPADTIRQLNESKELLAKAREDMKHRQEAKKIPVKHTFSPLPGFHGRKEEMALLRRVLSGNPTLNVIFGATSVGKTALLREVLTDESRYYCINLDLRISGFADLSSLYMTLGEQFQRFFETMQHEEMDKCAITFKHMRTEMADKQREHQYEVGVADVASIMESLQSCLLRYWEFDPEQGNLDAKKALEQEKKKKKSKSEPRMRLIDPTIERPDEEEEAEADRLKEEEEEAKDVQQKSSTFKKRSLVFFIDEAHKLPALVPDQLSLKVLLDCLLVLTKQDRLINVVMATSDSFFQHWLRSMNIGHHSHIMTVGDIGKLQTYTFFMDKLIETVPANLRPKVDFEGIWAVFGGKLSHITDYLASWINSEGTQSPLQSPIFTQAYTLLQFHLTHESFPTYSPLTTSIATQTEEQEKSPFTRQQLLSVMRLLTAPQGNRGVKYFDLCHKIGTNAVDGMIKTRILELRWCRTITLETDTVEHQLDPPDYVERPVVLPMTKVVKKAMQIILEEEDARITEEEQVKSQDMSIKSSESAQASTHQQVSAKEKQNDNKSGDTNSKNEDLFDIARPNEDPISKDVPKSKQEQISYYLKRSFYNAP